MDFLRAFFSSEEEDDNIQAAIEKVERHEMSPYRLAAAFRRCAPGGKAYKRTDPLGVSELLKAAGNLASISVTHEDISAAFDGYIAEKRLKPALALALLVNEDMWLNAQSGAHLPEAIARAVRAFISEARKENRAGYTQFARRILSELEEHPHLLSQVSREDVLNIEIIETSEARRILANISLHGEMVATIGR